MKRAAVALACVALLSVAPAVQAQGYEMFGTYSGDDERFDGSFVGFSVADDGVHDFAFQETPLVARFDLTPDQVQVDGASVTASGSNATVVLHDTPNGFVKVVADAATEVRLEIDDAATTSADDGTVTVRRGVEATIWSPGGDVTLEDRNVTASLDAGQQLMFRVRPSGSFPAMSAHEAKISDAVESGAVGAEAFVQGKPRPGHHVAAYAPMDILVDTEAGVTLTVDADDPDGRVIVTRVGDQALASEGRLEVRFNGEPTAEADGIDDILDPDDDGVEPEHLHARVAGSHVVLTSIPHFSTQTISIAKIVEAVRENPEIAALTVAGAGAIVALAAAGIYAPRRD